MKSPVGSKKALASTQLEDGLMAYRCPESGGHYISAVSYMRWLSNQPARLPQLPPDGEDMHECIETSSAKLCPETGTIMSRYQVGHGFSFTVDRSITGGIWLDAGEWEALRRRNFHDEIHYIFTQPWQSNVLEQERATSARKRLEERLGVELLGRVDALKSEIAGSPHREQILAYLFHD